MKVPDNLKGSAAGRPPSVGQTVTVHIRQYDVRLVDEEGGIYARFTPNDGSDPSDHDWPAGTDWTPWLARARQNVGCSEYLDCLQAQAQALAEPIGEESDGEDRKTP